MNPSNTVESPINFDQLEGIKRFFILGTNQSAHNLHLLLAGRFLNRFFGFFSNDPADTPDTYDSTTAYLIRPLINYTHKLGNGDFVFLVDRNEALESLLLDNGVRLGFSHSFFNCFSTYEAPIFDKFLRDNFRLRTPGEKPVGQNLALDIGANFGMTAAAIAPYFAEVRAFEPNRNLFSHIQRNPTYPDHIIPYNFAFSDFIGQTTFYDMQGVNGSLVPTEGSESYTVDVNTIDHYCEQEGIVPDFIKIDAENMDAQVLFGGRNTIAKFRPIIFFENPLYFADTEMELATPDMAEELYTFLEEFYVLRSYPCLNQLTPHESIGMELRECKSRYGINPLNISALPKERI